MLNRSAGIFFVSLMLTAFATFSFAQTLRFNVGDEVEALSYVVPSSTGWAKGKIIEIDATGKHEGPYLVHYDGQNYVFDKWQPADKVRSRPGQPAPAIDRSAGNAGAGPRISGGRFQVGDRVDVFTPGYDPPQPKGRGTIIEAGDGKYKVNLDGCKPYLNAWEDRMSVRPEATIDWTDPEIRSLVGSWAMFSPSYPNTVVHGGTVYREYGVGAKAPPLQIKADGSYIWYFDFGKPPVKGIWATSAMVGERKIRGAANEGISHTVTDNGIIIQDPKGEKWKIYKWVMPGSEDRITAHLMCTGETMVGSRIR